MVTSKNKYNSYSNWEARLPMQSLGSNEDDSDDCPENKFADCGGTTQKKKKKEKKKSQNMNDYMAFLFRLDA